MYIDINGKYKFLDNKISNLKEDIVKIAHRMREDKNEMDEKMESNRIKMTKVQDYSASVQSNFDHFIKRTDQDQENIKNKVIEMESTLFGLEKLMIQIRLKFGNNLEGQSGGFTSSASSTLLDAKLKDIENDLKSHIQYSSTSIDSILKRHDSLANQCQRMQIALDEDHMMKSEYERHSSQTLSAALTKLKNDVHILVDLSLQTFKSETLSKLTLISPHMFSACAKDSNCNITSDVVETKRVIEEQDSIHKQMNLFEKELSKLNVSGFSALTLSREAMDKLVDHETFTSASIASLKHQISQLEAHTTMVFETLNNRIASVISERDVLENVAGRRVSVSYGRK
jgi:hypothetical protein